MDELALLRDYVATMQRQLDSKNRQLTTLRQQNQKLTRENQRLSMSRSYVLNTTVCSQCTKTQKQISELQSLCNTLQVKYDNLQKQKLNSSLSSSVRVLSTSCSDCSRLKQQLQNMTQKYYNLEKSQATYVTSTKLYTQPPASCSQCNRLKGDLLSKQGTMSRLNSEISSKNTRISNLQSQVQTLTQNSLKSVTYSHQNVNRSNDIQRITYLNGQVQQYIALVNSLRSQIKALNQQNQRYILRIRELQSRPRQIQYIEKGLSPEIKEQIRSLKVQIGELSNDNILLRRQNAQLKREVMSLPKNSQIVVETQAYEHPVRFNDMLYNQERTGRHYRKSPLNKSRTVLTQQQSVSKLPHHEQLRYDDLQRKIELLQMQNEHLRGSIYTHI